MRTNGQPLTEPGPDLDLSPYEGRWVALVRGQIVGVGRTAEAAWLAARQSRPREEPLVFLVPRTSAGPEE